MLMDSKCISSIIPPSDTQTGESELSSLAPVKPSPLEPLTGTPSLFGESLSTTALTNELEKSSKALTAPCSETKVNTYQASLCDKLTPSLISAGLVRGTIPTSIRKRSHQGILDIAFFEPVGVDADARKTD
jgi:hypothetical protein